MKRLCKVEARSKYRLYVEFEDGACGVVDLADRLFGPMFEPLADPELFGQVTIDEFGAVSWPNGADLAPNALRRALAVEA